MKIDAIAIGTMVEDCLLSNYGSFLQHYALRKFLSALGFVSYRLPHRAEILKHGILGRIRIGKGWVIHKCGDVLALFGLRKRAEGFSLAENKVRIRRRRLFESDYRKVIGHIYEPDSFRCNIRIYGSDQIWSTLDGLELFPFPAKSSCTLLTYAVSGDWQMARQDDWKGKAKTILPMFSAISVREKRGCDHVAALLGNKVAHVCDPTLLLAKSDYMAIASRNRLFSSPTLFCYFVNANSFSSKLLKDVSNFAIENNLKLKICAIQGAERCVPSDQLEVLSPLEFLAAFRDAKYIVTNSFHGSIFALIFCKPFVTFKQINEQGSDQNIRIDELLESLGLNDRLGSSDEASSHLCKLLNMEIGTSYLENETFVKWRKYSMDWLINAIGIKAAL